MQALRIRKGLAEAGHYLSGLREFTRRYERVKSVSWKSAVRKSNAHQFIDDKVRRIHDRSLVSHRLPFQAITRRIGSQSRCPADPASGLSRESQQRCVAD